MIQTGTLSKNIRSSFVSPRAKWWRGLTCIAGQENPKCSWGIASLYLCLFAVPWTSAYASCHWRYDWNRTLKFAILFLLNMMVGPYNNITYYHHHHQQQQQCPGMYVFEGEGKERAAKGSADPFSPLELPGLTCTPGHVILGGSCALCLCFQLQQQLHLASVQRTGSASVFIGLHILAKSLLIISAEPPLLVGEGAKVGNFVWF